MIPGLNTDISLHQQIYLNSWHFLILSIFAVALVRAARPGMARGLILICCNIYFISYFMYGLYPVLVLGVLILLTYAVGHIKAKWGESWPDWVPVFIVVLLWICLFFIKDPDLLAPVNAFHYYPVQIIGISYLVFRSISYVLDVEIFEDRTFVGFINYMIFFPSLLAGPIERYDQFEKHYFAAELEPDVDVLAALHRIANGVIKKFVLADNLMPFGIFMKPADGDMALPLIWVGVMFQLALIYLDFSGYCDIVLGLARLMGIPLCENFDKPFRATNIQDFWNRWHISLSLFIRDYVFIPLNRLFVRHGPKSYQFFLIMATYLFCMMLIALWHGTSWGFFIFGLLQGAALIWLQILKRFVNPRFQNSSWSKFYKESLLAHWSARGLTYVFFSISILFWFFSPQKAIQIIKSLLGG